MIALTPMWRIYRKEKHLKLLGGVEATTEAEALDKAARGLWKGFWADEADKPTSADNLVAMI